MQVPWAGISLGCSGNHTWGKGRHEPWPGDLLRETGATGGLEQRETGSEWHLGWSKRMGYSPPSLWTPSSMHWLLSFPSSHEASVYAVRVLP